MRFLRRTARAAASLAVFTSGTASEASRGHAFPVGWKGVRKALRRKSTGAHSPREPQAARAEQ
eukprot:7286373-Prymnesium_polylepis.1